MLQNLQNLQTNISNFDFSTLSSAAQQEVYNQMKSILNIIIQDTIANTTDPSSLFTTLTNLSANRITPPQQVNTATP